MTTMYVNQKSELTISKQVLDVAQFTTFRTRTECGCTPGHNTRDAVLAINQADESLIVQVIRCRGCATQGKGGRP